MLDPRCELSVHAADAPPQERTEELGCGLQGPQSHAVRAVGRLLRERIERLGRPRAIERAEELCDWLEDRPEYRALCDGERRRAGRRLLARDVLYPPRGPIAAPLLMVRQGAVGFDFAVDEGAWPEVADLVAALARDERPDGLGDVAGELWAELERAGWANYEVSINTPQHRRRRALRRDLQAPGLCFVGHNTVLVATRRARLLVDPWFRPWHDADPRGYRPLTAGDLGRVDAIAITHAHGDHFHLGSLLQFPRDTPVYIPAVERDTLLAHDLGRFLRTVGFTHVRPLGWGERARVADLKLEALPFFGEQPTVGALVHPDVRNAGNTYLVRGPGLSAAFLADAGRDSRGDMREVALAARRADGPVDIVFTGCRAFALYPLFYPFTTLDAFLFNVPRELLGVRQQLMHDVDDALDVAESFGARLCVPYADGGAPWYWREGMGPSYPGYPAYPGWRRPPPEPSDDPAADPFPERMVERAVQRGTRVRPLVLRPGECLRRAGGQWRHVRLPGARWPY